MSYYVKFRKFNENTQSSLKNQEVRFSTVFELNDTNEIQYSAFAHKFGENEATNQLKRSLENTTFRADIIKNLNWIKAQYPEDNYREYENFKNIIENYDLNLDYKGKFLKILEQFMAFLSVGIFSSSDIKVFKGYDAHAMFSHYADNYKGLALIYKCTRKMIEVEYRDPFDPICYKVDEVFRWFEDTYGNHAEDKHEKEFKIYETEYPTGHLQQKQPSWNYEKEFRLLSKPGTASAEKYGFDLKAILYTSKLLEEDIKTLEEINAAFYEGKVEIQEIYAYPNSPFQIKPTEGFSPLYVEVWLDRLIKEGVM